MKFLKTMLFRFFYFLPLVSISHTGSSEPPIATFQSFRIFSEPSPRLCLEISGILQHHQSHTIRI
ncbi:hypothetical protein NMG60_11024053 [Bertholletia excelsa]